MYIHTYIHILFSAGGSARLRPVPGAARLLLSATGAPGWNVHPISLLGLSLLRFVDSKLP